jgi:hypothetical protein
LARRGPVVVSDKVTNRCEAENTTHKFARLQKERHSAPMKILFVAATLLNLNVPALAQAVIPAIPVEMLGVWGFKTEDCEDENGDGRLIVEKRRIASFASVFKLNEIRKLPHGGVQASATRFDEGERRRPRASLELMLITPDYLSVKSDRDEGIAYARCRTPGKTS